MKIADLEKVVKHLTRKQKVQGVIEEDYWLMRGRNLIQALLSDIPNCEIAMQVVKVLEKNGKTEFAKFLREIGCGLFEKAEEQYAFSWQSAKLLVELVN